MYSGEPLHKPFFIIVTLHGEIIIGPTKKLVTFYMVGDWMFWISSWEHEC